MSLQGWNYTSGQGIPAFKTVFTSMDKFLNSFYFSPTERLVPMDVVETDNAYELRIAVPGLAKDDIKVDVKSGFVVSIGFGSGVGREAAQPHLLVRERGVVLII